MGSDSENTPVSLGRYRILGKLGRGGMGVVLLGEDPELAREVAIKVLPPHLSGDPLAYARFQREARLLAALNHPNIATIHSLETVESTPILTMERIQGVTLGAKLAGGRPLPMREAVAVGAQIARALEAAHDRGVIHRDLKPGNVMIREDGQVKVLDFGLATTVVGADPSAAPSDHPLERDATLLAQADAQAQAQVHAQGQAQGHVQAQAQSRSQAESQSQSQLQAQSQSQSGSQKQPHVQTHEPQPEPRFAESRVSSSAEPSDLELTSASEDSRAGGTPGYMSPEQVLGQQLDERSDVFAFGCVLFECFAGSPFAAGDTAWERMRATLHPIWSADGLPPELPPSIGTMIEKCLTREIAERLPKIRFARQVLEETIEQWTVERRARETGILSAGAASSRQRDADHEGDRALGNLPRLLTRFVGRKREIAALTDLLNAHRMVTLTGPGGSGKTRLSVEAARARSSHFRDGVWFVELASVTDPRLIEKTIMNAMGIEERKDQSARDTVLQYFESRAVLVVLDNCEHLVNACADLVIAILRCSAGTKTLATSREALGVRGEARFVVPPLEAPDPQAPMTLEAALSNEAVTLFADRVQQVRRDFVVTAENIDAIVGICRRLDGLPLALELAASRARALGPEEILLRLNDRFRLLTGGSREQLPHHRTLWASIDWSHEQLDETERTLFRRLAVFVGGWSLQAAEIVGAGAGIEDWEILDALTRLIDKSLVEIDFAREASSPRYRMLETIREYAGAKLRDSNEIDAVSQRFLEHFDSFSRQGALGIAGPEAAEWLAKIELDYGNIREALRLSQIEGESLRYGLSIAASFGRYWITRNHWAEGRSFLTQLLDHPKATDHPGPRSRALNSAGALAYTAGDYVGAVPLLLEASRLFEAQGERLSLGRALMNLGNAQSFAGHYEEGLVFQDRALAIAREDDDKWLIAACLTNICNSAEAIGDLDRVESAAKEGAALFQAVGDKAGFLMAQNYVAVVAYRRGRFEEAVPYYESSLQIAEDLGDRYQAAMMRLHRGISLMYLHRHDEARADFGAALGTARELNEPMLEMSTIDAFVSLATEEDDLERAVRLIGFIEEYRRQLAMPRRQVDEPPFRDQHRELRARLGDAVSDELEAWGRTRSLDEAIAYIAGSG